MRPFTTVWLVTSGCLILSATASSQSLSELARSETARRAEIAETGETATVIDAVALSRYESDAFTAIEVSGAVGEISRAEPPELGRAPLANPNRDSLFTSAQTSRSRSGQRASGVRPGFTGGDDHRPDGRGWSSGGESRIGERGWSDHPAADRGYTTGGDYSSRDERNWSRGGESSMSGRGWSERPPPR